MRVGAGAAIGGMAQIASIDARILAGEQITRATPAEIPAAMIVGGATNAFPIKDPDIGRGPQAFVTGLGIGGTNAVLGNALQDLLKRVIADDGGVPSSGPAK